MILHSTTAWITTVAHISEELFSCRYWMNTYAYKLLVTSALPATALFLIDGCEDTCGSNGFLAGVERVRELLDSSPTTDDRVGGLCVL